MLAKNAKYYNDTNFAHEHLYKKGAYIQNFLLNEKIKILYKLTSCESFLDVGCSDGFALKLVQDRFNPRVIVGIDISNKYAKTVIKKVPEARFIDGDAREELKSFSDKHFDVVLCSEVLEHIENPFDLFYELFRVTKRYLIITSPRRSFYRVLTDLVGIKKDPFKYKAGHISEITQKQVLNWIGDEAEIVYSNFDCYIPNGFIAKLKLSNLTVKNINGLIKHTPYIKYKFPIMQIFVIKKVK